MRVCRIWEYLISLSVFLNFLIAWILINYLLQTTVGLILYYFFPTLFQLSFGLAASFVPSHSIPRYSFQVSWYFVILSCFSYLSRGLVFSRNYSTRVILENTATDIVAINAETGRALPESFRTRVSRFRWLFHCSLLELYHRRIHYSWFSWKWAIRPLVTVPALNRRASRPCVRVQNFRGKKLLASAKSKLFLAASFLSSRLPTYFLDIWNSRLREEGRFLSLSLERERRAWELSL